MNNNHSNTAIPSGRDFYKWIAPMYGPFVEPFLRTVRNSVIRTAHQCGCRRILDIACGTGKQVHLLARDGFVATGIDLSPAMLSRANSLYGRKDAFVLGNAENLPFPSSSFDCVIISLAIHEMGHSTAVRVVSDAIRVLDDRGKLMLFDYFKGEGFIAETGLALFHVVERIAGKRHYRNFKQFLAHGGMAAFMKPFPVRTISVRRHLAGTTALIVYEKSSGPEDRKPAQPV